MGTGGLVRAYSDATIRALEKTEYIDKIMGYEAKISVEYDNYEQLKYYVSKSSLKIINTEYLENIEVIVEATKERLEELTNSNNKKTFKILKCDILKEKYIEI